MENLLQNKPQFTCLTCHVAFKDINLHKSHYQSDWHRYNLKRKVAELPPVTAEDFQQKIENQKNLNQLAIQDTSTYCQVCRKSFGNQKAYENHLNSKKHKDNEKNHSERMNVDRVEVVEELKQMEVEEEEVDSDEWDDDIENPIDNNDCLFCSHHSRNFYKNLEHMTLAHSFFIPDIEYCIDLNGLLRYLGEKITDGFVCLWCNDKGRTFYSVDSVKQHMVDKGHCKMLHEGVALAEYADFYDYSSSYPDNNGDSRPDLDEEVTISELEQDDYQLVLPSGITVGHRSLMRYYKQSFNPNSQAVVVKKSTKKLHKVLAQYRALGWTATQQEAAARKARDLHYLKRLQAKLNLKLGLRANKFQKHYRPQVNF